MILYHGTITKFDRFKPYSFFTDSYEIAARYAALKHDPEETARVIQVEVDMGTVTHIPVECLEMHLLMKSSEQQGRWCFEDSDDAITDWLDRMGADVAVIHGMYDLGGPVTQYMVRDPARIRFLNETVSEPGSRMCMHWAPVVLCSALELDTNGLPF